MDKVEQGFKPGELVVFATGKTRAEKRNQAQTHTFRQLYGSTPEQVARQLAKEKEGQNES